MSEAKKDGDKISYLVCKQIFSLQRLRLARSKACIAIRHDASGVLVDAPKDSKKRFRLPDYVAGQIPCVLQHGTELWIGALDLSLQSPRCPNAALHKRGVLG